MEYEKIKQLIDDMGNSNLTSINIDFPDGTPVEYGTPICKIK